MRWRRVDAGPGARSAAVLVALAALLLLGAWLRAIDPRAVADLKPRPDALEYAEGARNLARGDGYFLEIEGRLYPPRYPPGMSALLAIARPLTGVGPADGVRLVLALSLLTVLAAWWLGRRAGGDVAGLVAALVVAVSPLDAASAQAIMSDAPSAALCGLVAAAALAASARGARDASWLALGVAAGLGSLLRLTNVVLAAPLLAIALTSVVPGETRSARARRGVALLLGVAVGLLPLLVFQALRFGSPLASGYAIWTDVTFGARYVWQCPLGSTGMSNGAFYPYVLAGGGGLLAWPFALLAGAGVVAAWRSRDAATVRLVRFTVVLVLGLLAVHVPFFWQDERFLLPVLAPLAACAGLVVARMRRPAARVVATVLLVLGTALSLGRDARSADARSEVDCLEEIDRHIEPDAALVLRTNAFFFRDYLRETPGADGVVRPRLWLPVGACPHRRLIAGRGIAPLAHAVTGEPWIVDAIGRPLDAPAALAGIRQVLRSGRPLYYATANREFEYRPAARLGATLRSAFEVTPVFERALCKLYVVREHAP